MEILSGDFGESWKLFLAHPSVERWVQMRWVDDLMTIRQWERVMRVLLVDYYDGSAVDEEMFAGNFEASCVEISEGLIVLWCQVIAVPQVARLFPYVNEEDGVVGFKNLKALGAGDLLNLQREVLIGKMVIEINEG